MVGVAEGDDDVTCHTCTYERSLVSSANQSAGKPRGVEVNDMARLTLTENGQVHEIAPFPPPKCSSVEWSTSLPLLLPSTTKIIIDCSY